MKKRKRKVTSPGQFLLGKEHKQECLGVSRTIPGDTFSIQELISRSQQGIIDNVVRQGQYLENDHDDPDLEKFQNLDFTERQELSVQNLSKIEHLKRQIKDGLEPPKEIKPQSEDIPTELIQKGLI